MSGTKKDPGECCNTNRGEGTKAGTALESLTDSTINAGARQLGEIEKMLPIGENNAIRTKELVKMTGCRNARELQSKIEAERLNGALILSKASAGGGYFLPSEGETGKREISAYIRTLKARAINTFRTLKTARRALQVVDGQTEIAEVRQNE